MKINPDIAAKAIQKQKENEYVKLCSEVNICPNCGEHFKRVRQWLDGGADYKCDDCGYCLST